MIIKEIQQDLFKVPEEYYLVQCISADFAMGKGIAVEFNRKFDMRNELRSKYIVNKWDSRGYCILESRVFNLITKQFYYYKPIYQTMTDSLECMRDLAIRHGIKKIAMPTIGCGLDRLNWNEVKSIIEEVFSKTDIEILVCIE